MGQRTIPLGVGAYKRAFGSTPEIQLVNRYVEKSPTNLQEHAALLARPGTTLLNRFDSSATITMTIATPAVITWTNHGWLAGDTVVFSTTGALPTGVTADTTYYVLSSGLATNTFQIALTAGGTAINTTGSQSGAHTGYTNTGIIRATFAKEGLFDDDLFVVVGHKLYRYASDGTETFITGVIYGDGHPYATWMKGAGYEYMFIADGLLLQYYGGGTHATGTYTVTTSSPPNITTSHIVNIGTAYYGWHATDVDTGPPFGTSGAPWLCLLGANDAESLTNLANMIKYAGVPGTDFSSALPGPSLEYTAESTATTLVVTALSEGTDGNAIATTETGAETSWGAATLLGGGVHALTQVETPDGAAAKALVSLASYVLVSIGNTRRSYWIEPGEVIIDPLNFAEKESQPDDIVEMKVLGDQALLMGNGSTENWYATGDLDAPFAPVKGQAFSRGVVDGTAVVVKKGDADVVVLVGDDSRVYVLSGGGFTPVSDHGIEERIRTQLRRERGLP